MAHNAPGKHYRKGLTLSQMFAMFPDDDTAEAWFINRRWPDGVRCPHCDCDNIQDGARHRSQRYRCRGCRTRFSARTGTVLADSNVGFRNWIIAIYLMTTSLKGVSSMNSWRAHFARVSRWAPSGITPISNDSDPGLAVDARQP